MRHSNEKIYPIERILAAATYLTAGGAGFIWLIIASLLKKNITPFLNYHIFQSIFLSIAYFILSTFISLIYIILYRIPIINAIPYFINMPIPILFGLSIIQAITTLILLYLAISSFMGIYTYIPWASDIIKQNTRR